MTVSARIRDESTNGITVTLYYREDGQADFNTLTMFDDGQHDDGDASDGVYAARIAVQPDGTIMEFFIKATDAVANSRTWPAPSMVDETSQQVTNALYQVNDSAGTDKGWVPGSQPIYYLIMTEQERAELEDIGDRNYSGDLFAAEPMSNAQMNATFISVDGVYTDIRYNVGVRNRGNRKRADPPMSYRVNFPNDNSWKNVTALNINSKYPHLELMGSVLFQMSGLPAADVRIVQLRVNAQNLAADDYNNTYGSYSAIEVYDSDWANNHFPDDANGNLYRCTYYEDGSHPRTLADLDYKESAGQTPNPDDYRNNYIKKTNEAEDEWSDLFTLIDKLNNDNITDDRFVAEVSEVINLEKWMRFLATDALLGNREGGLTSGSGDDYAMYRGVKDPRFWLLGHDLDTLLGQGDHDYQPQWDIFEYEGVDGLERLLGHPDVIRLYYRQYKDLAETVFAPDNIFPLIDRLLGDWVPNSEIDGQRGIKQFIIDRRNSILYGGYPDSNDEPQIPQQLTIDSDLSVVNGFYNTNIPVTNLSGTFNAIKTRSILVNGLLVDESDFSQKNGTWSIRGVLLNPGINRIIVQAFDGPGGTGNKVEQGYIDVRYDTGSTNNFPDNSGGSTARVLTQTEIITPNLIVRDSYLPGIPVLVRMELLNEDDTINRNLWDAEARLSVVDNPNITLSTDRITMYNGLGSELVSINGSGDFTLNVEVNGLNTSKVLADWSDEPIQTASGDLAGSQTWSGIYHITGDDFTISSGSVLTLNPGTLVLIDGVSSGSNGTDIDVAGSIQSLGTADSPVTITAFTPGRNWGELHHDNAAPSTFLYTNITQAGHSPRVGHSNSGPTIRASGSTFVFEHCSLTDNAGKIGHVTSGSDMSFKSCLFARSVMGPEISGTALLFENSWITDMHANDDADGIYIHGQQSGQKCTLTHGVAANMDDDGIDTLGSEVTIQDFIVRDCKDKGISIYGGEVDINYCLIVENNKAPEDPTIATIATKTVNGATAIVNIDHTTIVSSKAAGHHDVGIQSHNKYGVTSGTIIYNVTNSIIDATDPVDIQSPYLESDIYINYSDIFGETWPGTGNLNAGPMFVDQANHDYRLSEMSPCINAGDPNADPDPDLTVTDQGYTWFDREPLELPEGSLGEDTIWTPQEGPYRVTGELTVPPGAILTILPGTTVFFDPDAKININGRLIAEGKEYELTRFTRTPEAGGTWDGIQFVDTMQDNRFSYAVIEYGRTNDGMVGLKNSNLMLDHVTLDNTDLLRIRTVDSSLIVRNSVFTDIFDQGQPPTTDNRSEHIWGSGVPEDGQFIIEDNLLGTTPGHNDGIDFDGPSRPGSIPQIMNNIFMGGGDDALDLECDAHIEGNLFMNYIKDQYNRASGESNVISAGAAKHYVMVRNIFYNVDHIAQVKNEAFLTFVNNTAYDISGAGIYFELGLPGRRPGQGAYIDGNIFWNTPLPLEGIDELTTLAVNNSILPADWHTYGDGNIDADPVFVDSGTDFRLKAGSPAIGTGPCGLDMGAYVSAGAAICGEPDEITYHTDATLIVGGPGITHYKYSLNSEPRSEELPVDTPIVLNNLLNGRTYTVYVIGKNSAGIWQNEDESTASRTWTIDTSYSKLVINEVLAINSMTLNRGGTFPDLIELYYDGPTSLSLSGMSITDNPDDPRRFVMPEGASIRPDEYMVLYADSDTTSSGIHLGFALDGDGEGLYLYDNSSQLLDSVEFGMQLLDLSIGRIGDTGRWSLTVPTFGQANIAQPLSDQNAIRINEWLADGLVLFENDFIELYNSQTAPVDLSGLFLTDNPVTQPDKYPLGPLGFIAGEGFAVLRADNRNRPGHVDFRLSADNEMIGLDTGLNQIDKVLYGPQTTDVSYGRAPDGSDDFGFLELPTPGVSNPSSGPATITTINLVPENADKRVLVPTEDIGEQWRTEIDFDDSAWELSTGSPGGIGYERSSGYEDFIGVDTETQMYDENASCYIRIPFSIEANELADLTELTLKIRYDDGFVAYLNGVDVARRNFNGSPAWNSQGSTDNPDSAAVEFEDIDISAFLSNIKMGKNILAIQGLNGTLTSSDLLISAELDGIITMTTDNFPFANAMALLDGLRVTELMYHASAGSNFDYIELQNIGNTNLDLTGVRLSDGINFVFPAMTLESGQYVVVVSNIASFRSTYGTGVNVAGEYSGNLSNGGEKVVLSLPSPLDAAILRFEYRDTWYPAADGNGSSLTINDSLVHPAGWSESVNWHATTPSPGE
ncbi:lamin tail domain-containing protein [Planctomycetota bacterium]